MNFFSYFFGFLKAMYTLLHFIRLFFAHLSFLCPGNKVLEQLLKTFPKSVQCIRSILKNSNSGITEYVVCPRCNSLYNYESCVVLVGLREESRKCSYIEFPNHPQQIRRKNVMLFY